MGNTADRVYKLASAIMASGRDIRPAAAILIAMKLIEFRGEIERFKHETAQAHHDC